MLYILPIIPDCVYLYLWGEGQRKTPRVSHANSEMNINGDCPVLEYFAYLHNETIIWPLDQNHLHCNDLLIGSRSTRTSNFTRELWAANYHELTSSAEPQCWDRTRFRSEQYSREIILCWTTESPWESSRLFHIFLSMKLVLVTFIVPTRMKRRVMAGSQCCTWRVFYTVKIIILVCDLLPEYGLTRLTRRKERCLKKLETRSALRNTFTLVVPSRVGTLIIGHLICYTDRQTDSCFVFQHNRLYAAIITTDCHTYSADDGCKQS